MSRKVFISFLGASKYTPCRYSSGNFTSESVTFVHVAALKHLTTIDTWTENDVAYILLTEGAKKTNWVDDGLRDRNTGAVIPQKGLRSCLMEEGLPMSIQTVEDMPDGNNRDELWDIINKVFNVIKDEDELYFDLTHGYRYLPMLVLVLGNYSKFLKNATVKSVTYGNFEGRNQDTNIAQFVDLLPLVALQDWTFAAANYIKNGYVDDLVNLAEKELSVLCDANDSNNEAQALRDYLNYLKSIIKNRIACRGIDIVEGTHVQDMRTRYDVFKDTNIISPLMPVMERIEMSMKQFSPDQNIENGIAAAKWCMDNGLAQQAITIMQETIVTMVCIENGIDYKNWAERGLVNSAFYICRNKTKEEKWDFGKKDREHCCTVVRILLETEYIMSLCKGFCELTDLRNDYNHAGFRDKPKNTEGLIQDIEECMTLIDKCVKEHNQRTIDTDE